MNIFAILLIAVTVFLLFIKLIASLTGRVSERLLTNHFRALEALLEHDQLPADWVEQLKKMARSGPRRVVHPPPWEQAARPFLLKKIRQLHRYFADCPFVEGPEARALLLEQLETVINRWEGSELPEILAYYDLTISD